MRKPKLQARIATEPLAVLLAQNRRAIQDSPVRSSRGSGRPLSSLTAADRPKRSWMRATALSAFGTLSDESEEFLQALLRRCVTAGWVVFSSGERPVVRLTADGRAVMHGQRPARLLLPHSGPRVAAARRPSRPT